MRLVVSGASGFIGSAVTRHLLKSGHDVAVLARPSSDLSRLGEFADQVEDIRCDLSKPSEFLERLAAFSPKVGIHCAWDGITSANRDEVLRQASNYALSLGFLDACQQAGVSAWVGLGSQAEYGISNRKLDETAATVPVTAYGAVKLSVGQTAKVACDKTGMRFVWVRVFQIYGPGDNADFLVPTLIVKLLRGKRHAMTAGTQIWDLLHKEDASSAISHIATRDDLEGVYNLGSGDPRTIRCIAEDVRDAIDPSVELGFGEVAMPANGATHLEADIGRLEASGWRPRISWEDGIRDTIEWHRANMEQ